MEPWPLSAGPTSTGGLPDSCRARLRACPRSSRSTAAATYVRGERDERLAQARGRLRDNELWGCDARGRRLGRVCDAPGGRYAIEGFLPRRSKVSRKTPWLKARSTSWSRTSTRFFSCRGSTRTSILDVSSATSWPPGTRGRPGRRADEARRLRRLREARRGRGGRDRRPVLAVSNVTAKDRRVQELLRPPGRSSCSDPPAPASRRSSTGWPAD